MLRELKYYAPDGRSSGKKNKESVSDVSPADMYDKLAEITRKQESPWKAAIYQDLAEELRRVRSEIFEEGVENS